MEELALNGGVPASPHVIGYGRQVIRDDDIEAVVETLRGDYLTCGPATSRFEEDIARQTKASYAVAVSNGTAALHVACLAAGIGPGDEVIVSPITFAASANCVLYCGGMPVFADIDPQTWNINPDSIREKITEKTKAVVAVDFGGVPVQAREIRQICDEHGLVFIEDAAHSLGSCYDGSPVGSIADITTFSFHPVKTITTGEGGAVTTNDSVLYERLLLFAKHGITRDSSLLRNPDVGGWYYEQLELGYNYRISDIQAALGSSQMKKLPEFSRKRKQLVGRYNDAFSGMSEVSFQHDETPDQTVRHLYCLRFDLDTLNVSKRFVYDALRAENIGVNVHYLPVYRLPYYQDLGFPENACPEANKYYEEAITMPLHPSMTDADQSNVVKAVSKVIDWCLSHRGE